MESLKWWLGVAVIIIIYLWSQNNTLHKKVDACWNNLSVANYSIQYANAQLNEAHDKAGSDYQTMDYTLQQLEGTYPQQDNPCDKNYIGDLSNFPTQ